MEAVMGRSLTILLLALTSLAGSGGGVASVEPVDLTGVTVTFVDATVTQSSSRPKATTIGFQGNAGPATVVVRYRTGTDERFPAGPVALRLNDESLLGPLELREAGGEVDIDVDLVAGANQLEVRVFGHPTSAVDIEVVQHLGPTVVVDTVWGGHVLVGDSVVVLPGAVLTVLPGTTVAFEHYRGYREPARRLGLTVLGGIVAEGDPLAPISLTSDAVDPRNGDWAMVRLETPSGPTRFDYVVFEFAQQGLNVWQDDLSIAHGPPAEVSRGVSLRALR
jgi:hypothetical protein